MFLTMNNRIKTRIKVSGVTSYSRDKGINHSTNSSWPTIHMTIGSVVLILAYDTNEDRDADIDLLDRSTEDKNMV